jgi:hypothetical protein
MTKVVAAAVLRRRVRLRPTGAGRNQVTLYKSWPLRWNGDDEIVRSIERAHGTSQDFRQL